MHERDEYYEEFFTRSESWSRRYPNADEATRAGAILSMLAPIADKHYAKTKEPLKIIDVGCGRGWLTNLLSLYGTAIGLEPVRTVVVHARELFPQIEFLTGDPQSIYRSLGLFDVVVCSEVIEHVSHSQQFGFVQSLRALTKENGHLVLSTPRAEVFHRWRAHRAHTQPVEDWLTEKHLVKMASDAGFDLIEHRRCKELLLWPSHTPRSKIGNMIRRAGRMLGVPKHCPINAPIYQIVCCRATLASTELQNVT